ncbi:NAD(P)-dependent oxidoreductase [Spirosoma jeollabukense]
MRLAILGATGGTGRALVQQALDKGHQVTAIVRQPDAITLTHSRLQVISGDVMQPDSLARTLPGHEAVLSVVGQSSLWPMIFYRQSARNIIEQMEKTGVDRLICMTSVGVLDKPVGPWWYVWFIKPLLKNIYKDMQQMEQIIRASRLTWTIVRPSRLFDGPHSGHYQIGSSGELSRANSISRADVADCLLTQLETKAHWHQAIAVAY